MWTKKIAGQKSSVQNAILPVVKIDSIFGTTCKAEMFLLTFYGLF